MTTTRNTDWYLSSTERKVRKAQLNGYRMGLLSGLVVLNDYFDFTDDELSEYIEGCKKVVASISDGSESAEHINSELEKMTGVSVLFGEQEGSCQTK